MDKYLFVFPAFANTNVACMCLSCLICFLASPQSDFFKHFVNVLWVFAFKIFKHKWITSQEMTAKFNPCVNTNFTVHFKKFF